MTKFEEILRKIKPRKKFLEFNAGITYWYCLSDLIQKFGNWHSDEEFQYLLEQNAELTKENNLVNQINSKLDSQINDLKSQLQQQSLPVVPECVAEWYEEHKDDLDYSIYSLCEESDDTEPNREPTEFESWFDIVSNQPILTLVEMRGGYTVEKPQLFYMKHIDMSKLDETHDWFILHHGSLGHSPFCKGELPYYCNNAKFTQAEIGSMETGSYELVPVGDGE